MRAVLRLLTVLGAVAVFTALPTLAGEAPASATGPAPAVPDNLVASSLRVLGAVLLITALCFAGAWLLRNWQRFALRNPRGARLAVLEVRPLGQRHALYVVGYERERLLLAASPAGVSLLCHLPPATAEAAEPAAPAQAGFADTLAKALHR